jgi:SAM-dependent methyltransferase
MNESVDKFYDDTIGQSISNYEQSHAKRFDFLVSDLKLNDINNSSIADFGCGYAPIFRRMSKDNNNKFYGFDGAYIKNIADEVCEYHITDLNLPFANDFLLKNSQVDYAFSFETFEHLPNPYNCLVEIKKILKPDGILYLSIPHVNVTHNTLYPGLIYPIENFATFIQQMAFEILDHRIHDKAFIQNVLVLKNKDWNYSKMLFYKDEVKFRNIEPLNAINL